jgi:hypothetical protein
MPSPRESNELSFERDIKPLFRTKDRDSMLQAFELPVTEVPASSRSSATVVRPGRLPRLEPVILSRNGRDGTLVMGLGPQRSEIGRRSAAGSLAWVRRGLLSCGSVAAGS